MTGPVAKVTAALRMEALTALAAVPPEFVGSRKIRAIKILRDATGLGLKECIPLIDWAIEQADKVPSGQPATTLAVIRREVALEIGGRIDETLRRVRDMPADRALATVTFELGGIIGDYTKTEA